MLRIEINECMFWIQTTATNKTRIPTTKPCQYKPTENNNRNHNNNSISCCSKPTPHPLRMLIFMSSLRLIMRERCNLIQFHAAAPERTMVGAGPTKRWKKSILYHSPNATSKCSKRFSYSARCCDFGHLFVSKSFSYSNRGENKYYGHTHERREKKNARQWKKMWTAKQLSNFEHSISFNVMHFFPGIVVVVVVCCPPSSCSSINFCCC